MKHKSRRLVLFVLPALLTLVSGWDVYRSPPEVWPPVSRVSVVGTTAFSAWPDRTEAPTLVVSCERNKITVYVETSFESELYGNNYDTWLALGRLGYDDDEPDDTGFRKDVAPGQLHFRKAKKHLRKMFEHDTLFFEFTPSTSAPTSTTFDLRGLSEHRTNLRERCRF